MPFSHTPCQVLLIPEHSVSLVRISSLYPILSLYIFPANILDTLIHSFYKGNQWRPCPGEEAKSCSP